MSASLSSEGVSNMTTSPLSHHHPLLHWKEKEAGTILSHLKFFLRKRFLFVSIPAIFFCVLFRDIKILTPFVEDSHDAQDDPVLISIPTQANVSVGTLFSNVTQGDIQRHATRNNIGHLSHELISNMSVGILDSCKEEANRRIKHVVRSNASSLTWERDDVNYWEVINVRGKRPENAHILIKHNNQTIRIPEMQNHSETRRKGTPKGRSLGAEDPRVVVWKGFPVVIFHSFGDKQMWLYYHKTRKSVLLTICGHSTSKNEKNWTPLVIDDKLFLVVYSIDPLVILHYDIDSGSGVCTVIYGNLPLRGMKEPYGGTPFKELSFAESIGSNAKLRHRTFLSMAHSKHPLDHSNVSLKADRVYRPVPIVLRMSCTNRSFKLNSCEFLVDTFHFWPEVESPSYVPEFVRKGGPSLSVSYPYDLEVFQDDGLVRVGIEFENCFSMYQDFTIDFGAIENRTRSFNHGAALNDVVDLHVPKCHPKYSHAGRVSATSPMANEDELARFIDRKIWVVSHGGVSSTRFRNQLLDLDIAQSERKSSGTKKRPLHGVIAHFPYPIEKKSPLQAPSLCVYIYGSVYNSILSQIRRHPDNSKKLHNDESYHSFDSIESLLAHPDPDPFGVRNQFENFLYANVSYPIVLVRYEALLNLESLLKLESVMSQLTGNQYNFTAMFDPLYERKTSANEIQNDTLRDQFLERYADVHALFDSQPLIRVLMPQTNAHDFVTL